MKKGGYGIVFQEVLRSPNLEPESKAIYAYLASFAGYENTCFPSRKMMLNELKMSETRFSKYMNPLVALGVVSVVRECKGNILGKNVYTLNHEIRFIENKDSRHSENVENIDFRYSENAENDDFGCSENGSADNLSINNNSNNNINNINTISSEPDKPALIGSGILLPLIDKTTYDVPLDKISTWKQAYPAVDVEQEFKKMVAWLESNPKKKKTRRGVDQFINGWLERAQNRGGYAPYTNQSNEGKEVKIENKPQYVDSWV
ncbi:helix-turn-helix domain-containing protein [Lacrimispora sp. JR3]|uniref:helix-turn-helix domain-containing protein n=1 Tax=Lacrimispora sinapis TaxID=3111456 RepID=UPI003748EFA2